MPKRVVVGIVTKDSTSKTRRVEVGRLVRHPKYGKYIRRRTVCYMHDENNESGLIFTMNAGWFSRSSVVAGTGVCMGDTQRDITAEEIADRFEEIKSLENAQPYASGAEVYNLCAPLFT